MVARLTKEQLIQIDKSPRADFHLRLIDFLREQLPEQTGKMDDVALLQRIVESEKKAARYGISSEAGVSQWVCLTFLGGTRFDEMPEVNAFLHEPEPAPEQKLQKLVDCLGDELKKQ